MQEQNQFSWQILQFDDLTVNQLLDILILRAEVFVVEQNCAYCDPDTHDKNSHHVLGYDKTQLVAVCRILPPDEKYSEASIGRVVTATTHRGLGLGKELMQRAITYTTAEFPQKGIRISAQEYLREFYTSLGFVACSDVYLEDDIPHIEMLRE
jgi:ElaA protein